MRITRKGRIAAILATIVLVVILAACGGETTTSSVTPTPDLQATVNAQATTIAQQGQSSQPTLVPPTATPVLPTPTATQSSGLSPQTVQSWCHVIGTGTCDISRFEQLTETNGAVNSNGVHMKDGDPVSFDIPSGISADVWDCFKTTHVVGPIHIPQTCQASFRKTG